jgi:hypothetical protein
MNGQLRAKLMPLGEDSGFAGVQELQNTESEFRRVRMLVPMSSDPAKLKPSLQLLNSPPALFLVV